MEKYVVNGAIGIKLTNLKEGRNYLPYVSDLKDRTIKYIDIMQEIYTPDDEFLNAQPSDMALSLVKKGTSDLVYDNVSAVEFCPKINNGKRVLVGFVLDLEKSFINVSSYSAGEGTFIVFYYEDDKGVATHTDNKIPMKRTTSVVKLTNGRQSYFSENRTINGKHFLGIYPSFSRFSQAGEVSPISEYFWDVLFVNLVRGSDIFVRNVPLYCLLRDDSNYEGHIVFDGVQIDFTNSFLEHMEGLPDYFAESNLCCVLGFDYKD